MVTLLPALFISQKFNDGKFRCVQTANCKLLYSGYYYLLLLPNYYFLLIQNTYCPLRWVCLLYHGTLFFFCYLYIIPHCFIFFTHQSESQMSSDSRAPLNHNYLYRISQNSFIKLKIANYVILLNSLLSYSVFNLEKL